MSFSNTQKDGSGLAQWLVSDADGNLKTVNSSLQAVTLLASTGRSTSQAGADLTNPGARGVLLMVDVTGGTPSLTPAIQAKDPVSGKYANLFSAATAIAVTGMYAYVLYPGVSAAGASVAAAAPYPLPKDWRLYVTHGNTNAVTYSCGAHYLP